MSILKIALGSDHAGFELKELIKEKLAESNNDSLDFGTHSLESCDYPDFAAEVGRAVAAGRCHCGVIACGTGQGSAIVANKIPGVRAAVCWNEFTARMARLHNDANVLALAARVLDGQFSLGILNVFLTTSFSEEERHSRRIDKICALERP